jgi:hypothetical protein
MVFLSPLHPVYKQRRDEALKVVLPLLTSTYKSGRAGAMYVCGLPDENIMFVAFWLSHISVSVCFSCIVHELLYVHHMKYTGRLVGISARSSPVISQFSLIIREEIHRGMSSLLTWRNGCN